jgi:hypothetical protein
VLCLAPVGWALLPTQPLWITPANPTRLLWPSLKQVTGCEDWGGWTLPEEASPAGNRGACLNAQDSDLNGGMGGQEDLAKEVAGSLRLSTHEVLGGNGWMVL